MLTILVRCLVTASLSLTAQAMAFSLKYADYGQGIKGGYIRQLLVDPYQQRVYGLTKGLLHQLNSGQWQRVSSVNSAKIPNYRFSSKYHYAFHPYHGQSTLLRLQQGLHVATWLAEVDGGCLDYALSADDTAYCLSPQRILRLSSKQQWQPLIDNLPTGELKHLLVHQDTIYLVSDSGLYLYQVSTQQWKNITEALTGKLLKASITTQGVLQLQLGNRLYMSEDKGGHWQPYPLPSPEPFTGELHYYPTDKTSTVYALLSYGKLQQSTLYQTKDNGQHWRSLPVPVNLRLNANDMAVTQSAIYGLNAQFSFSIDANAFEHIERFDNHAEDYSLESLMTNHRGQSIAIVASDGSQVLYQRDSKEPKWHHLPIAVKQKLHSAVIDDDGYIYLLTELKGGNEQEYSLYKLSPGSIKPVIVSSFSAYDFPNIRLLDDGALAINISGTVATSLDGGNSWQAIKLPARVAQVFAWQVDSTQLSYFSDSQGTIYRSENGGASWQYHASIDSLSAFYALPNGDLLIQDTVDNNSRLYLLDTMGYRYPIAIEDNTFYLKHILRLDLNHLWLGYNRWYDYDLATNVINRLNNEDTVLNEMYAPVSRLSAEQVLVSVGGFGLVKVTLKH